MQNFITNFKIAFTAEHIKIKRKGIYVSSIIVGIIIPIAHFLISWFAGDKKVPAGLPANFTEHFMSREIGTFYSFLFPLLLIITISRITQIDHKNGGWKLMETHPLFKASIFFSKLSVVLVSALISIISYLIMTVSLSLILTHTFELPEIISTSIPWLYLIQILSRLFITSLFLITVQYVLSVLISNFILPIGVGVFMLIATPILAQFYQNDWTPVGVLFNVGNMSDVGNWFIYTDYSGLLSAIMVTLLGFVWYKYKSFKGAFLNKKRGYILGLVLVSAGLVYLQVQPKQMTPYPTTVINGKMESNLAFNNVFVLDNVTRDTLVTIPITDGKFHHQFKTDLVTDYYTIYFDRKLSMSLFFGNNDSIYIDYQFYNRKERVTVTGTRLAENRITSQPKVFSWQINKILEKKEDLKDVEAFSELVYSEWEKQLKIESKYRTNDNYVPKDDFNNRNAKIITIRYLNYWQEFLKIRTALEDDEKVEDTPDMEKLRKTVSLSDESMLTSRDYIQYLKNTLIADDKADETEDIKFLDALIKLPIGSFRNKLLAFQLNEMLETTTSGTERNQILNTYLPYLENVKYANKIKAKTKDLERISKGEVAPTFLAINQDQEKVVLADLQGKYLLIDVWATWCGPCKTESPFFEKLAKKYEKENIQFVSLSMDRDAAAWFVEVKTKSKHTLNLLLTDQSFLTGFAIKGIPRFIFINPEGLIVNARMPRPSEDAFEYMLRNELSLPDE